jgi:hypothetical protein
MNSKQGGESRASDEDNRTAVRVGMHFFFLLVVLAICTASCSPGDTVAAVISKVGVDQSELT